MATEDELISWHFIRNNYENIHNKNVPAALKYLVCNFSMKVFRSNILTMQQDLGLVTMLHQFKRPKLLFRASENAYLASKFHESCDGKGPTVTIIRNNFGNIFGGYTNIPWSSTYAFPIDKGESFLFLLHSHDGRVKCPKKMDIILKI